MNQIPPAPPLRDGALVTTDQGTITADVVIIGSGMGGGTVAWALKDTGLDVLIVERGQFLPREPENSQPDHVFIKKRYVTSKPWYDAKTGQPFQPGVYYWQHQDVRRLPATLPPQRLPGGGPPRWRVPRLAIQLRRSGALPWPGRTAFPGPRLGRRGSDRTTTLHRLPVSTAAPRAGSRAPRQHALPAGPAPLPHGVRHAPAFACRANR
jgi:NAD(P)-binding Rossmann-like domain